MVEIIFNKVSVKDLSQLKTLDQLELLEEFRVRPEDLDNLDNDLFGKIEREGKTLYRYRAKDFSYLF